MTSNTDDLDDEYLDDPISLMAIEVKKEIVNEDQIIDILSSSDEEEICTSYYGKKNFVLPVTFFDNYRNVRLLNKCKPMSISVVDCKEYPAYYTKSEKKSDGKSDESSVEIDIKSDSENKANAADAQNIVSNVNTLHKADKKNESEKKRRGPRSESFYEKLKRRKENSKQTALSCKDLSQVDFKRNIGLVGLKITDDIFKQIINTEMALIKTKKSAANKYKEIDESGVEKPFKKNDAPKEKSKKIFNVVEKALSVVESIDTKSKENKQSETEKELIVTESIDSTKDKFKEKSERVVEKTDRVVERALAKTDLIYVENQCKKPPENDAGNTLLGTSITSVKDNTKDNSENNMYIKEVGAALDNLGTTIIPVTDNPLDNAVSNNVTVTNNIENKSIKTHKQSAAMIDKLRNSNDIEMRCSLKIPSKKIVEKLKLKHRSNVLKNTIVQQIPTETISKYHTVANLHVKPNKRNIDGSYAVSDKDTLLCKSMDDAYSRETKQVEKPVDRNASRNDHPGSNSPVIPCTTITVRPGPPKSSQNIPSLKSTAPNLKQDNSTAHITPPTRSVKDSLLPVKPVDPRGIFNGAQKSSQLPNTITMNQTDISINSRCTDSSKQPAVVAHTKAKATSGSKDISNCTQNSTSNLKTLKITEYKPPNNDPFAARLYDIKSNISAPKLADQKMLKMNLTKEANEVNMPIISATFSGSTLQINNQTTVGLINYQTCSNTQMSPSRSPKFSGHNAIIFRRPPPPHSREFQNNIPPNQGQPIQTVINYRPQYQIPHGSTPMRFRLPSPYPLPPPNYQPPPYNYASPPNLAQVRPNQIFNPPSRMSSPHLRGIEMGINHLRFPGPRPPGCGPPLQIPPRQDNMQMYQRPQSPQVNKDSFIGNTADGDPIKKINIPPPASVTDTVNDKQMMLAELNNAVMSPELTGNNPEDKTTNDLKRKAEPKAVELVQPKYLKPCPLSKKVHVATDLNQEKNPDKAIPNSGYSPPILPIMTYAESFRKFKNDTKGASSRDTQNRIPSRVKCAARIIKLDNKKQKITQTYSGKRDKANKITFDDYRKRAKEGADMRRIDVDKIRKHNESKNVADDFNQDLGYDSDSTVKL